MFICREINNTTKVTITSIEIQTVKDSKNLVIVGKDVNGTPVATKHNGFGINVSNTVGMEITFSALCNAIDVFPAIDPSKNLAGFVKELNKQANGKTITISASLGDPVVKVGADGKPVTRQYMQFTFEA